MCPTYTRTVTDETLYTCIPNCTCVCGCLMLLLFDVVAAAFDARLIQGVSVHIHVLYMYMVKTGRLMLVVNGVVISSVGRVVVAV